MQLPVTLLAMLAMILLWIVGAIFTPEEESAGVLSMSVSDAMLEHIRPWVHLTAGFYHPHVIQLVFILPATFVLGKRVEPEIGSMTMLKMLVFANTMSTLSLFADLFGFYILFRDPSYLTTNFAGFYGGITALLVGFMKDMPNASLPSLPGIKRRFYPILATTFFSALSMVGSNTPWLAIRTMLLPAGPYSLFGGFFGWYYLRFLAKNADRTIGDVSEDFALVSLLPDCCGRPLAPLMNFCFNVARLCGYFTDRSSKTATSLPVYDSRSDPITERRKARAMRALDEKLAKLATARET